MTVTRAAVNSITAPSRPHAHPAGKGIREKPFDVRASEWFLADVFTRGMRVGLIGANGIDGRPGDSHPGDLSVRNLRGVLVAVEMPELTRERYGKRSITGVAMPLLASEYCSR